MPTRGFPDIFWHTNAVGVKPLSTGITLYHTAIFWKSALAVNLDNCMTKWFEWLLFLIGPRKRGDYLIRDTVDKVLA